MSWAVVDPNLDGEALVDWELETVELTESYRRLQFSGRQGAVAVAPLEMTHDVVTIAIPADVTPWLPSYTVRLADPVSMAPTEDGECVTVSVRDATGPLWLVWRRRRARNG